MTGPRRKRARGSEGFSLVEVLGGAVIIAIAIPGIVYTTVNVARLRRADAERNLAMGACQSKLEALRNLPIADLPACHGVGFKVDADQDGVNELRPVAGDSDGMPGEVAITVQDSSGTEKLYRVRATVRWAGQSGVRTFWLETLMTDRRGG